MNSGDRVGRLLADGLGWFSLALGAVQIGAPDVLNRQIGVDDDSRNRAIMRGIGARDMAHGIGILGGLGRRFWVWSRVAADAMDLTLLGIALGANKKKGRRRRRTGIALVSVAGVTLLDLIAPARMTRTSSPISKDRVMQEKASITVKRPIDEVYVYWHEFENLPRFMEYLQSVSVIGPRRSRWKSRGPAEIEWDIEVTDEVVNELIKWRSVNGSSAEHSGSVRFTPAPGGRGTEVTVEVDHGSNGFAAAISKIVGAKLDHQLRDELRRFKQIMETGEIVRSEASPEGTSTGQLLKQRPAQPLP